MKKGETIINKKFETPYKISGMCKYCTPEKPNRHHRHCFNINCICEHHGTFTALHMREKGLRTRAKPGDFDYKTVVEKPFCDDRAIEGLNEEK